MEALSPQEIPQVTPERRTALPYIPGSFPHGKDACSKVLVLIMKIVLCPPYAARICDLVRIMRDTVLHQVPFLTRKSPETKHSEECRVRYTAPKDEAKALMRAAFHARVAHKRKLENPPLKIPKVLNVASFFQNRMHAGTPKNSEQMPVQRPPRPRRRDSKPLSRRAKGLYCCMHALIRHARFSPASPWRTIT